MMVADELCDYVAFITAGDIGLIDAPGALKKRFGKRTVRIEYLETEPTPRQQEFPLDGLAGNEESKWEGQGPVPKPRTQTQFDKPRAARPVVSNA
jgi:ABC-type multidrug transport system ATPase subunit